MFFKKIVVIFICFFSMVSCYSDIDFKQIEDYSLTPEITSSLFYFTILPKQFFNQAGVKESVREDITDFRAFENSTVRGNVTKIIIDIEIKNEFDRDFSIQIDLLNDAETVTYSFQNVLMIPANELDYKSPSEEILIKDNSTVTQATKIRVIVRDLSTESLDSNAITELEFKSSLKVFLDISA